MRFALINPPWSFEGSIYFGCREPHLPLEFGYAKRLLERAGHEAILLDGQLDALSPEAIGERLAAYRPDFSVVTTAPSYLFWRCAPPELRVPQDTVRHIGDVAGTVVAVGPHASTTPTAALRKLGAEVAVLGECEEILPRLAGDWDSVPSICYLRDGCPRINGAPHASDMEALPPLTWERESILRHRHHHHRFDAEPAGPGAEIEFSRGCPYHCSFCAKDNFRDDFRKRPLPVVLEELDSLLAQGVEYVYFIDEIFLPNRPLLEALAGRAVKFGVQTRIDLWSREMLDLLGRAGCVSIEAGIESITENGRELLDKRCRISTGELAERLIYAKGRVPFVQANLLDTKEDSPEAVEEWRGHLNRFGVWANKPVPFFVYPGSPEYVRKWGQAGEGAWERAHEDYLRVNAEFSDVQEQRPLPLVQLELKPES
ncbi:MAG: TIGR04295 family B12-binding domain-containing radical SAM protein [Acidobacteria bacterium]|nr:TIGR04295 family B12-binding domain-containing radical SAM protein [Acidobacteriota bacterium]